MDDEAGGLFNIDLSESETEDQAASAAKPSRTGQTEEDYQTIKRTYHARVENGNVSSANRPGHWHLLIYAPRSTKMLACP